MTGWRKKQIDDAMAGDGGYEIGTQEGYEAFVKVRNQSLAKMRIRELMLQAGTDTSGKWMNTYHAEKFATLIISDCLDIIDENVSGMVGVDTMQKIEDHFGVRIE